MKIINFVDFAESETTPTIGNIVASSVVQYVNDAAYVAAEQGAPLRGNLYYNTTDENLRYYNGTTWQELIDENSVQALENKAIDADTNLITNIDNNEIKPNAGIDATKLADGSVTDAEFQRINSVTSNVQDQIDSKMDDDFANVQPSVSDIDLNENDLNNSGQINFVDPSGNGMSTDGGYIRNYSNATLSNNGQMVMIGTNITSGTADRTPGVTTRSGDVYSGATATTQTGSVLHRSGRVRSGGSSPATGSAELSSGKNQEATNTCNTGAVNINSGENDGIGATGDITSASGDTNNGKSGDNITRTGDSTGDSGDIVHRIGTATGTQGVFQFIRTDDAPVVSDVWTCSNIDGTGYWETPTGGGGADADLNNLTSPTSVNQNLLPSVNDNKNLGSGALTWGRLHANLIYAGNSVVIDVANKALREIAGGTDVVDWSDGLVLKVPSGKSFKILETGNAPTAGDVLTASNVDGTGYWAAPASGSKTVVSKTAAYTMLTSDDVGLGDTTSGAFSFTLYTAVGNEGDILDFKHTGTNYSNFLTLDGNASETIDGETTHVLRIPKSGIKIISDNANWQILEEYIPPNRIEEKILTADVTTSTTISDWTCNNLIIGNWYHITGLMTMTNDAGIADSDVYVDVTHNALIIGRIRVRIVESSDTSVDVIGLSISLKFKATATTLTFISVSATSGSAITGGGGKNESYIQIEETVKTKTTTDF